MVSFCGLVALLIVLCHKIKFVNLFCDKPERMTFYPSGNNIIWPSEKVKNATIDNHDFDPRNIIATRMQFCDEFVYLTFPKYRKGVPFSLGRMSLTDKDRGNPSIWPYPSWTHHDPLNPEGIRNAVDLFMDTKGVLWVLDVGVVFTLEDPIMAGPPRVIGIDPQKNKVLHTFDLNALTCNQSRLQFVVAEPTKVGTMLYISDAGTRTIVLYNTGLRRGYRVMLPPHVNQESPQTDVLYLTIARLAYSFRPTVVFTYLRSKLICRINTCKFRRQRRIDTITQIGVKPAKMVLLGSDYLLNLFFRFSGDNVLYKWNIEDSLTFSHFVYIDQPHSCRIATHITPGSQGHMWALESNIQDYISGQTGALGASVKFYPLVEHEKPVGKIIKIPGL